MYFGSGVRTGGRGLPEDISGMGSGSPPMGRSGRGSPKNIYRLAPGQSGFSQEDPDLASSGFWGTLARSRDGSLLVPTDKGLAIRTPA